MASRINGVEYSWANIQFFFLGKPVFGCTGMEYTTKQEKKNVYATGFEPVARAKGPKTYEGSITLLQSEYEALQKAVKAKLPNGDLCDIEPFDITVSYIPSGDSVNIVTDTLQNCEFLEVKKQSKQGDMNMEVTLPLIIGGIVWGK